MTSQCWEGGVGRGVSGGRGRSLFKLRGHPCEGELLAKKKFFVVGGEKGACRVEQNPGLRVQGLC